MSSLRSRCGLRVSFSSNPTRFTRKYRSSSTTTGPSPNPPSSYIDDVWASSPPPIFPSDPYDRAAALFWSNFIDDKMFPNFRGISVAADEGAKEGEMEKLLENLSQLEDVLTKSKGNKFFGGERIGWLDIALGSLVGWFKAVEVFNGVKLFDGTPSLSRWVEDFGAEDAVRGVLPSTQEFVQFGRGFSNKLKEAENSNNNNN